MNRRGGEEIAAAATTTTTTAAASSLTSREEIANIESKLESLADKVAELSHIHQTFLERIDRSVKVSKLFENETSAGKAEERSLEGRSRTF